MTKNIHELPRLTFRLPPGVLRALDADAAELGITRAEYLRAACSLSTDSGCPAPTLVLSKPDRRAIAVTGNSGRIVGTLQDVLDGTASLDGPEASDYPALARLPIIVDGGSDLERRADGTLTGRIAPTRRLRRPGAYREVKVARARAVLAELSANHPALAD